MKKRLISIALAAAMLFSLCHVFAAETGFETDKESFLRQLAAIPAGVTASSQSVTRGEFVETLASLMGAELTLPNNTAGSAFYDVYGINTQTAAIVYLEQRGVISGDDIGMFRPDDAIKLGEAVRILAGVMGYDEYAKSLGGYPDGYMKTAAKLFLSGGMPQEQLTGRQMIDMLYNALDANIMEIDSFGGVVTYTNNKNTFLSGIMEVGVCRGVIDSTEYTGLYNDKSAADGCITIDGTEYKLTDKTAGAIDYLGYRVDAYYRDDGGENTLIAYRLVNNKVLKLDASEVDSFEDYRLKYKPSGTQSLKTVTFARDIAVIYNGEYTDVYNEELLKPDMGSVTLIANNSSGKYDVVIVESYKNYVVSAVDVQAKRIYNRLEPERIIEIEDDTDYVLTDADGISIDFSDIAVNSVLSVSAGLKGSFYRMTAALDIVEGVFSSEDVDGDDRTFVIGDKEYPVSADFKQTVPSVGSAGKFFLDFRGNVAFYISSQAASDWCWGYIVRIYYDEQRDCHEAKILQTDNIIACLPFADKVNINGATFKGSQLDTASDIYYNEGFQRQLIRYRVNAQGQISRIQTATKDSRSPLVRIDGGATAAASAMRYRSGISGFNYKVYLNSNTNVFVVPKVTGVYDEISDFRMESTGYLADNKDYSLYAYTVGENMSEAAAIVLVEDSAAVPAILSDWANLYVVSKKKTVWSEDDTVRTEFTMTNKSGEQKLLITENALANVNFGGERGAFEVEAGDTVRYSTNTKGEINYLQLIYDVSRNEYRKASSSLINASFTADTSMVFGTAYSRTDDNSSRVRMNISGDNSSPNLQTLPIEKFPAVIVDMTGKYPEVSVLQSAAQVRTYETFGEAGASKMVYMAHQGAPASMVVYIQ